MKLARKILIVVFSFLFGVLILGTNVANANADIINSTLGIQTFEIVEAEEAEGADTTYYKSTLTTEEYATFGATACTEIVEEGSVLLKNENNVLPLKKGDKVSLMGSNWVNPVYGGTGSGSISKAKAVPFVDSVQMAGLTVNETILNKYKNDWKSYQRKTTGSFGKAIHKINEVPKEQFTSDVTDTLDEYSTAICVFGRNGGEGNDLRNFPLRAIAETSGDPGNALGHDGIDNNDGLGFDYLGLNQNELDMLEILKAKKDAGKIKKIIVLLNFASQMEGNFIDDPKYGIDAAMWIGTPGEGGKAIGELLVGDVSPSGRLSDTMWYDNAANPVNVNFTPCMYQGAEAAGLPTTWGTGSYPEYTFADYTVYQEGMYLGYRYTETRYEDLVLGTANVGNYDYNKVVYRPFGFGMSYADFETSDISVKKTGDRTYNVSVKVTNKSATVSGKYSVPVWISKPYGDYAKRNGIQVPSVELIDFGKTDTLAPGASETLSIDLDEKFFASYDAQEAKTYVLMGGDYYVCVGGSSHDATNNLLMAKKANGVSINENKMIGTGDASKVVKFSIAESKTKYCRSDAFNSLTGQKNPIIHNLFDFADINRYEGRGSNHVDYYDRANWAAVSLDMVNGYAKLTATEQMAKDEWEQVPFENGKYNAGQMHTPEQFKKEIPEDNIEMPKFGVAAGLQLIDLRVDADGNPINYYDPIWDKFLDQLTWDELKSLPGSGQRSTLAIASVGKPGTKHNNGPNGIGGTGFSSNGTLAATFSKRLAINSGITFGEDGFVKKLHGVFGLGLNIHRSNYSGRVCEYYSECGTLTGIIGALQTREMEKRGLHVFNKHCALNDMETNRHGINDWINEQALREIYLRAFELPVYEGGCGLMASFSRFGTWSAGACGPLGTGFFREECGMLGPIVTDYYGDMNGNQSQDPYYELGYGVYSGGTDLCDGGVNAKNNGADHTDVNGWTYPLEDHTTGLLAKNYGAFAWAVRNSAKRVLYYTLTSSAMNGIAAGSKVVYLTPWWQPTLLALTIVCGVIAGGLLAWAVVDEVLKAKK